MLRQPAKNQIGGRTKFFVPEHGLTNDAFFLSYGGLHWGYADILAMPVRVRKQFVEMLERQLQIEKEAMGGK